MPSEFTLPAPTAQAEHGLKQAGALVLAATLLCLVALAHHPVASGASRPEILGDIAAKHVADNMVHGAVIAVMGAFLVSFTRFAVFLGLDRLTVLAGLVSYAAGVAATIGAALLDGFTTPAIALHYARAMAGQDQTAYAMVVLCQLSIQSLTHLGLVLISLGVLAWSMVLSTQPGLRRAAGLIGVGVGLGVACPILLSGAVMTPHSLLWIFGGLTVWHGVVASLMLRAPIESRQAVLF